ncbi:hypothetical protein [Helcobacillus massiliensis]|uniref:Uncharacterized protein n=2 Tax=Helcobacillus massiliensis TaxID=521392 RepID=A0A839R1H4_9MICO|nr:hypothetical protein [Helcobacillus massiliensis]MBB3023787.1 hypothetical protein [Helcobacillus massiliensis]MDK7741362.1 hypothetical protein [Helcobacillus massiliensis]
MPPSIMLLLIAAAILLGVMLSWGLSVSSQTSTSAAVPAGSQSERGVDASGLPVLTENSIGKEVQRLVDTGTLQNPASFDVTACMQEQGVDDQILMIEEVSWMDSGPAWLLVHSATTADVIHTEGGEVNATVVRSSCGTPESKGASSSRLWNGAVKLVPTS